MTQQEKAQEVLAYLYMFEPYRRKGLSEQFLRDYARKKWVGKDEPLDGDVLIAEAENMVAYGYLTKFARRGVPYYKIKVKSGFRPPRKGGCP